LNNFFSVYFFKNINIQIDWKLISEGQIWFGVDINKEDISDNFTSTVWEPAIVKINSITAASGLLEIKFNNSFFYINIFLFK
jgi:hypothetical protein